MFNISQELCRKSKKNKRSVRDENNFYKNLFFETLILLEKKEKKFTNTEEDMQLLIDDLEQQNKKLEKSTYILEYNLEQTESKFKRLACDYNRLYNLCYVKHCRECDKKLDVYNINHLYSRILNV